MNRIRATLTFTLALGALAVGCGGDPDGLRAQGAVALTVRQAGQSEGTAGFNFPPSTFIDAPPGIGRGFYGTCARSGNRWTFDVTRADAAQGGLRRAVFSVPERSASGAVNIRLTLGASEYEASSECTASAVPGGVGAVHLTAMCTNVRSGSDPRTLDVRVDLALDGCASQ